MIELLIILIIAGVAMAIGVPALQNTLARSRTEGFVHEFSSVIQQTRLESIRRNRPGIVYLDGDEVVAFVNVDGDNDNLFQPGVGPSGTTDLEVVRLRKPSFIRFEAPAGHTVVEGLSTVENDKDGVVLRPDGSVDASGAFRIADLRGNHLEIRIEPAATGRIELRMYMDGKWYAKGDPQDSDRVRWEWK